VTRRERGFALLIVLWSMALLALIGTEVTVRIDAAHPNSLSGTLEQERACA